MQFFPNSMKHFVYKLPFTLESGEVLNGLTIAYHSFGQMNAHKDNIVWVCHHLTANTDVMAWWGGMMGPGCAIDPAKHFVICANVLGSCYGTTGPLSIDPSTGRPYYSRFPAFTIRDMVKAHILLREHLGIPAIHLLIGGSMGGYQALEWSITEKHIIRNLVLLCAAAAESAWGIAVHTAQRLSIEADSSWGSDSPDAGKKGLRAARAIGLISYRNHGILVEKQTDPDTEKTDGYKASSYMIYQGDKLVNRFNAYSYWLLTKAMDSHQIARNRSRSAVEVLKGISQRTLIIGIHSDILCPLAEQEFLARHIPDATLRTIDSAYGHDGFIVETTMISSEIREWLDGIKRSPVTSAISADSRK